MKKTLNRFKHGIQDFKSNLKKKLQESKEKPKSKRKSFILGFTTAVAIFGFTLFGPALSAVAKDLPKGNPKPTDIALAPCVPPSKEIINSSLSGLATSVCGLAITSGSFALGIACGCIVVIGILHMQGK
jgi:MFS family permease